MGAVNWRAAMVSLAIATGVVSALPAAAAEAVGSRPHAAVHTQPPSARAGALALGPGGTWGPAHQLGGMEAGDALYPGVTSVSCASAGNCGALGRYFDSSGNDQLFVANEAGGVWGAPEEIPGLASANAGYSDTGQISCASAGNCSAVGYYTVDGGSYRGFVVSEANGTWGSLQSVPGIASLGNGSYQLTSIACPSAGNCSAAGVFETSTAQQLPFVVDETNSVWGSAEEVAGAASLSGSSGWAIIVSVSCGAAGECSAGGSSDNGVNQNAFVVDEIDGTWGAAHLVPGLAALATDGNSVITSMSCASTGNCSAGGDYQVAGLAHGSLEAFVVDETGGTWGDAEEIPGIAALNTGGHGITESVSCPSAGNCAAGGIYWAVVGGGTQAFVVDESDGTWGTAIEIPGLSAVNTAPNATFNSISCASAGNCSAGGSYYGIGVRAFVASESNGTWGNVQEVPGMSVLNRGHNAAVESISCPLAGYCSAGGYDYPTVPTSGSTGAFVVNEATASTTTLSLTADTATYGDEESIRASTDVESSVGGTPTGTVSVSAGSASICTAALTAGTATCTLQATELPAGTYQLSAGYSGDANFVPSSSADSTLTVSKATTQTQLTLSKSKVKRGREATERLSVMVTTQYGGVPTGDVAVKAGKAVICVIKLRLGKGSCVLRASQLKPGTYHLKAHYQGATDLAASSSTKKRLAVEK